MLERIKHIPLYQDMLSSLTEKEIQLAGYFDDGLSIAELDQLQIKVKTEYSNKLRYHYDTHCQNNVENKPTVILSIAGCFSPLHHGHIHALDKAKCYFEEKGYFVALGILFYAHDSYVDVKNEGAAKQHALNRIDYGERLLHSLGKEWIVIDEYPALHLDREVNFPFLIERLNHINEHAHTAFVFGEDNIHFANAFTTSKTLPICIQRQNTLPHKHIHYENLIYLTDNEFYHESSTKIRNQNNTKKQLNNSNQLEKKGDMNEGIYILRDDVSLCIPNESHSYELANQLVSIFEKYVEYLLIRVNAEEQLQIVEDYIHSHYKNMPTLSLDCWYKANYQLRVSRVFKPYSVQLTPEYIRVENSLDELTTWIHNHVTDSLLIVDDDIASGYTKNFVISLIHKINPKIHIFFESMLDIYLKHKHIYSPVIDIVDLRDFIKDSLYGGLYVVMNDSTEKRVMYTYPIVNLVSRAKLLPIHVLNFSKEIIKLNEHRNKYS